MQTIYIEAFSGISGNMFLGALLDLGVPVNHIAAQIEKMHLGDYELISQRVNKCGIDAAYFNVLLPSEHHHNYDEHNHSDGGHNHSEHSHGGHNHSEHSHEHHHEHRNLNDIRTIITNTDLDDKIKIQALAVFQALAEAEAKVHGKSIEEIHFHEVGAIDTIIDIVGCALALDYLKIEKIFVSTITTGRGFVRCAHGLMPIPAPATAELLQGLSQKQGVLEKELTTPTGAALMKVLATVSADFPQGFQATLIGYGAGTWDLPEVPNVVRVSLGDFQEEKNAEENLLVAASNIDDMSAEIYPYIQQKLLDKGALDVWLTPIIMKKGRPSYCLSALLKQADLSACVDLILKETTTLGVRYHQVDRITASRAFMSVKLAGGMVKVKYGEYAGKIINIAPEFEDCQAIAQQSGEPLKKVIQDAYKAAEAELG